MSYPPPDDEYEMMLVQVLVISALILTAVVIGIYWHSSTHTVN